MDRYYILVLRVVSISLLSTHRCVKYITPSPDRGRSLSEAEDQTCSVVVDCCT